MYKYLGIEFNKNCTFEEFKSRVLDKARKNRGVLGVFWFYKGSLSVAANITLWEGVIRTGMEYGAEIWGEGQWEEAEMIQREVGRRILGCSKMTSNAAVRGELGWWSLSTRREFLMLKYWLGILLMKEERLVRAVYNQSKREYIYRRRRNWVKKIHFLACKYGLDYLWTSENKVWDIPMEDRSAAGVKKFWVKEIFNVIHRREEEEWRKELESQSKLRKYKNFKSELKLESYLS